MGVIPDNFLLCKRRLDTLLKRLRKNKDVLENYDNIIKQQEADGIVESAVDTCNESGRVHYIPHREVIRRDKENWCRIVYDGSAKGKNQVSLNDCLEKGPCLLPKIFEILVRFRCYEIAVVSDIKSAFLNIRVDEKDREN